MASVAKRARSTICSFWLVSALAEIGQVARARALCAKLLSFASPLHLYGEELDAHDGAHLGNFPQAFSHLALINAVMHVISADEDARYRPCPLPNGPGHTAFTGEIGCWPVSTRTTSSAANSRTVHIDSSEQEAACGGINSSRSGKRRLPTISDAPVGRRSIEASPCYASDDDPRGGTNMSLVLLPAVDVSGGAAVRLVQGAVGSETDYGDPFEAALRWQRDGAEWVHLVDLDAAFGRGNNRELLAGLVRRLDIAVELSGGIRDECSLAVALATGTERQPRHGGA